MAATAKKTASKKTTKKTTASAAPARTRTTTKKATGATASSRTSAKKTTRKRTASARPSPLFEREPAAILGTAGYAATSLVNDVITLARNPERLERLEGSLGSLRERLGKDLERSLATFTRAVDHRAADGRKVVDVVVKDDRVARVLDQTSLTRSQLKAALTSVTKTADVAADAAGKQAGTARSQIKGATTTVRNSTGQARSQVKGAATSVRKIADAAYSAAGKQAPSAVSQVRGAATSVRRSAGTIVDAAVDTAADAEAETRS